MGVLSGGKWHRTGAFQIPKRKNTKSAAPGHSWQTGKDPKTKTGNKKEEREILYVCLYWNNQEKCFALNQGKSRQRLPRKWNHSQLTPMTMSASWFPTVYMYDKCVCLCICDRLAKLYSAVGHGAYAQSSACSLCAFPPHARLSDSCSPDAIEVPVFSFYPAFLSVVPGLLSLFLPSSHLHNYVSFSVCVWAWLCSFFFRRASLNWALNSLPQYLRQT